MLSHRAPGGEAQLNPFIIIIKGRRFLPSAPCDITGGHTTTQITGDVTGVHKCAVTLSEKSPRKSKSAAVPCFLTDLPRITCMRQTVLKLWPFKHLKASPVSFGGINSWINCYGHFSAYSAVTTSAVEIRSSETEYPTWCRHAWTGHIKKGSLAQSVQYTHYAPIKHPTATCITSVHWRLTRPASYDKITLQPMAFSKAFLL